MAVIVGKIQPLKEIKESLEDKGINRFSSIGDINSFIKNYEAKRRV